MLAALFESTLPHDSLHSRFLHSNSPRSLWTPTQAVQAAQKAGMGNHYPNSNTPSLLASLAVKSTLRFHSLLFPTV